MATERWIAVRNGHLQIVEELDGAAYLAARRQGTPFRWVTPTTIEELVHQYGEESALVREARALRDALGIDRVSGAKLEDGSAEEGRR